MGSRKKRRNDGKARGGGTRRAVRFGGTPPQERYYKQGRVAPEAVGKYMSAGEGDEDEDKTSTSARRPPAVVYGTTPRPIPEAAGAVARSMNTLEGINWAYDQT